MGDLMNILYEYPGRCSEAVTSVLEEYNVRSTAFTNTTLANNILDAIRTLQSIILTEESPQHPDPPDPPNIEWDGLTQEGPTMSDRTFDDKQLQHNLAVAKQQVEECYKEINAAFFAMDPNTPCQMSLSARAKELHGQWITARDDLAARVKGDANA